jgi:adenylate kinase family enzyme
MAHRPVTGTSYRVEGAADCPHFARCERLAEVLRATLRLPDGDVTVQSVAPEDWEEHIEAVRASKGFLTTLMDTDQRLLVWCPLTDRLVGQVAAMEAELLQRYGVQGDLTWGTLQQVAKQNHVLHTAQVVSKAEAVSRRAKRRLSIAVLGPAGSGKATLGTALKAKYRADMVSLEGVLREVRARPVHAQTELGAEAMCYISLEEEVPEELATRLIIARLREDRVGESGYVLVDFPVTVEQAWALFDQGLDPKVIELSLPIAAGVGRGGAAAVTAASIQRQRAYLKQRGALLGEVYVDAVVLDATKSAQEVLKEAVTVCEVYLDGVDPSDL